MWCKKCNHFIYSGKKECCCKEFIIIDEYGEKSSVYAKGDEESAALEYAQEYNEGGDYSLMDSTALITINGKKFEISAEASIEYNANEI